MRYVRYVILFLVVYALTVALLRHGQATPPVHVHGEVWV
jgi:hypothetical protein